MDARIYLPAKNAMQSGRANTRKWVLEMEPAAAKRLDPLMGWTGSADTDQQVVLRFETLDEAVAFAKRKGLTYEVYEPHMRDLKIQAYADKFRWDRVR
ncbi:ETC complex I subunit [Tistrella mobilis]|jgi:hypothetical protein|uniref:ETC complex I subunit region n=2 Tax=Tistrella mobilis TaxID=171437 RepID=I3TNF2_TISMK|nr:ETC complex I subunit [Tistrella mobilis]AFK54290.1 ETC complex I subunit region [Tistrella mobilis KA081020-065]KYO55119.1 ETC complex I subunit [Tistrella mobilis]MAM73095.1 ETC complex I subunit [Tistrella sp.]|tara:strand:- start:21 stop:314 length:294 start_codon:yes stop_codon:yes gene_type:complete